MAKCLGGSALHEALRAEMTALYQQLNQKSRDGQDAEDAALDAMAQVDSTEVVLENVLRDLDGELAKVDRADPSQNAQRSVFPRGFGEVIDPDGEHQLTVLPALRVRLEPFKSLPGVEPVVARLDAAEVAFRAALTADGEAESAIDTTFAEEQEVRRAIREQLESAYGRLRDFYRAKPGLAEAFFLNEGGTRHAGKAKTPAAPNGAPAPVAQPPAGTPA